MTTPSDLVGYPVRSLVERLEESGYRLELSEATQVTPCGPLKLIATGPPGVSNEPIAADWRILLIQTDDTGCVCIWVASERDRVTRKERPCSARGS